MKKLFSFIIVINFITIGTLKAEIFCVTDATSFTAALHTAGNNGQDDEIRLASGNYVGNFLYFAASNEAFDLTISGGWTPFFDNPCFYEGLSAFDTVIDGNDAGIVLNVLPVVGLNVTIKSVTIINGESEFGPGGLNIYDTVTFGDVLLDRVAFIANEGEVIGALRVVNGDHMTVRNSLFILNNTIQGSANIYINNFDSDQIAGIYFHNNTVINNTSSASGPGSINAGVELRISGANTGTFVANNILWGNTGYDLVVPSENSFTQQAYNNNIEDSFGTFSSAAGNLSQAPVFSNNGFFDYTPVLGSPEVDNGRNPPPFIPVPTPFGYDWSLGDFDINGNIRSQSNGVDIGAYEASPEIPIFKNGFDDEN